MKSNRNLTTKEMGDRGRSSILGSTSDIFWKCRIRFGRLGFVFCLFSFSPPFFSPVGFPTFLSSEGRGEEGRGKGEMNKEREKKTRKNQEMPFKIHILFRTQTAPFF